MSLWNFIFDGEYRQRSDIEGLKAVASRMARGARVRNSVMKDRVEQLEQEIGELTLLCRSLLTVLRESGTVQPEALEQAMHKIDLEDGVADGKVTRQKPTPQMPKPKHRRFCRTDGKSREL